jgi:hypothetical protein
MRNGFFPKADQEYEEEREKTMKRICMIFGVALTLGSGALSAGAHGGYCYGPGLWPIIPLAFGLGAALSCAAGGESYSYPVYASAPEAYAYEPASTSGQMPQTAQVALAPQNAVWVPKTAGAGHWVPDLTPYSFSPLVSNNKSSGASNVTNLTVTTITHSPGNVPVYIVSH